MALVLVAVLPLRKPGMLPLIPAGSVLMAKLTLRGDPHELSGPVRPVPVRPHLPRLHAEVPALMTWDDEGRNYYADPALGRSFQPSVPG